MLLAVGRRNLWAGLHQISFSVDGLWLVGGDFNVIAYNGESTGRNTRDSGTSNFADVMKNCGLTDAGYSGGVRDAERVDEAELDHDRDPFPSHRDTLHQVQAVLNRTLSIDEAFWKQNARARWICEGDHNTRCFHSIVQGRRIRARIQSITSASGESVDPIRPGIIPRLVSDEDNLQFNWTPTLIELQEAIFSIDLDNVVRPDRFSSHFFQVCWDIISEDVFQAVLDFIAGGHLLRDFATTSIVLLPKRENACRWLEFRPISLCTMFNKLITKLVNS
ncbi:DNAse I-like superfamily protein [Abeliophyllum distichum]|uniref:DNAse I-like superfamily protein n=1 Tax=Abeliophyllum distichum TaxID=126358 RepID=A0ABD1U147_9LAMI